MASITMRTNSPALSSASEYGPANKMFSAANLTLSTGKNAQGAAKAMADKFSSSIKQSGAARLNASQLEAVISVASASLQKSITLISRGIELTTLANNTTQGVDVAKWNAEYRSIIGGVAIAAVPAAVGAAAVMAQPAVVGSFADNSAAAKWLDTQLFAGLAPGGALPAVGPLVMASQTGTDAGANITSISIPVIDLPTLCGAAITPDILTTVNAVAAQGMLKTALDAVTILRAQLEATGTQLNSAGESLAVSIACQQDALGVLQDTDPLEAIQLREQATNLQETSLAAFTKAIKAQQDLLQRILSV